MKEHKQPIICVLLLFALLPFSLGTIFTCLVSSSYVSKLVESEVQETLKTNAYSIYEFIDNLSTGTLSYDGEKLYSGVELSDLLDTMLALEDDCGISSTIFYGDTRALTTLKDTKGKYILNTKCSDEVSDNVLVKGNSYFAKKITINNSKWYGYYLPIKEHGNVVGMVFTGKPMSTVTSEINSYILFILSISAIMYVLFSAITTVIGFKVRNKTRDLVNQVTYMSKGDLVSVSCDGAFIKEFNEIAIALQGLRKQLTLIVDNINNSIDDVVVVSKENTTSVTNCNELSNVLTQTTTELASGATSMSESVQESVSALNTMSISINEITDEVEQTSKSVDNVTSICANTKAQMNALLTANTASLSTTNDIVSSINNVSDAVKQITEAIDLIVSIAKQTDLLALNASIEAARAGDAGRGFTIVANEIKKLSEESNKSAEQIKDIIEQIIIKTESSVELTNKIESVMHNEASALQDVHNSFDSITSTISDVASSINNISSKTAEMNASKVAILDEMESLSGISEQYAASTEEANASMEEMHNAFNSIEDKTNNLAKVVITLTSSVAVFNVKED